MVTPYLPPKKSTKNECKKATSTYAVFIGTTDFTF